MLRRHRNDQWRADQRGAADIAAQHQEQGIDYPAVAAKGTVEDVRQGVARDDHKDDQTHDLRRQGQQAEYADQLGDHHHQQHVTKVAPVDRAACAAGLLRRRGLPSVVHDHRE